MGGGSMSLSIIVHAAPDGAERHVELGDSFTGFAGYDPGPHRGWPLPADLPQGAQGGVCFEHSVGVFTQETFDELRQLRAEAGHLEPHVCSPRCDDGHLKIRGSRDRLLQCRCHCHIQPF